VQSTTETLPSSPGEALVAELKWIHGLIRHDLEIVRQVSDHVMTGAPAGDIREQIGKLETSSPLWQLRVNCLHYCRFVHTHHTLEDVALFPELRRSNPALGPVVDKLEADHKVVSDYLDEIDALSRQLMKIDTAETRAELRAALSGLSEHLLAHLAFEEVEIAPTLLQWEKWPHH
jgi:hypothetical protein